jgi:hypothetical protein
MSSAYDGFDQQTLDVLQEAIYNAVYSAFDHLIREGILLIPKLSPQELGFVSGAPSTTPPGSPKISPQELGTISPGGTSHISPGGILYTSPGGVDHEAMTPLETREEPSWICPSGATRRRAFSEPPVSIAPFAFAQRCAHPQSQSISRLDAKPYSSQRALLTRGPSHAQALPHHLQSSSGLGYTWFNACWLNTCSPNACRLTWDPGIEY